MKKLLMILFLLILTGCNPVYNLTFENGKINEEIHLWTKDIKITSPVDGHEDDLNEVTYFAYNQKELSNAYQKKIIEEKNGYKVILTYEHDPNRFSEASALQYFKYHAFINQEDSYLIKLEDGLIRGMEDNFTSYAEINIKTDNKVLQHNADKVKGNVYTWKITKKNAENKEILFQVSKTEKKSNKQTGNVLVMGCIALALSGVVAFVLWFACKKLLDARFQKGE